MCKPRSEGGQRCAYHTGMALSRAATAYAENPSLDNHDVLQAARADYAATPTGRSALDRRLGEVDANSDEAIDLQAALRRGGLIRERNQEIAAAQRDLGDNVAQMDLAADPNTNATVLARIYRSTNDPNIRDQVLLNPGTSVPTLSAAFHGTNGQRAFVARHPNATPHMIDAAVNDALPMIRLAAARRPDLRLEHTRTLAGDENLAVRQALASATSHQEVQDRLAADPQMHVDLAGNPNVKAPMLDRLVTASHINVAGVAIRQAVAMHPNAASNTLDRLTADPDHRVSTAAHRALTRPAA